MLHASSVITQHQRMHLEVTNFIRCTAPNYEAPVFKIGLVSSFISFTSFRATSLSLPHNFWTKWQIFVNLYKYKNLWQLSQSNRIWFLKFNDTFKNHAFVR
jgi:hypothetical protein